MIEINLSEEQAKSLLMCLGWRMGAGSEAVVNIKEEVARELFAQLEHKLMPASTSAAELAVWRHENGLNEMDVEKWKRKNGKAVDKVGFVGRCIMVNVEKFR
ncbi:hypothetical protein HOT39_gp21 [Escherichia phage LL5]|uniref:Uncharacterized protein n=1 Tax=Escherichia phage LL5 TaxID=2233992 RepID=A0A2Z4Q470_9CAUD|nr:hypothetical protein HOT39_gp21 [Escherichia phage LL5]AWY04323.1 hypothetical protein CPT_LL5_21 [Escherichia phage LL5]